MERGIGKALDSRSEFTADSSEGEAARMRGGGGADELYKPTAFALCTAI